MMRLACYTGHYPCWSEQFLQRDLQALAERGHEILVWPCLEILHGGFARWHDAAGAPQAPLQGQVTAPLRAAGYLLAQGLLQLRHLPMLQRSLDLLPWQPDAVLALFGNLPAVLALGAARTLGRPLVVWLHAHDVWVPYPAGESAWEQAAALLVCNAAARDEVLRRHPGLAERTHLIHHGLQMESLRQPLSPPEQPLLLAAGRFVEKKGFGDLIEALPAIRRRYPQTQIELIGEGPEEGTYRRLRKRLDLQQAVRIRQRMEPAALSMRMREATAMMVPSKVDREGDRDGIPNVLLEAMAQGVPVIGSDAGGLPEVLDPQTGWPARSGDVPGLAAAVCAALSDPQERARRALAARERVRSAFSAEVVTPVLEERLAEAVATAGPVA